MYSSIQTLLLLAAVLSPAIAVPADVNHGQQPAAFHSFPPASRPQSPRNPLTRLRDSLIQRLWGVPHRHERHATCSKPTTKHSAPPNFRRRYNGDVVLRFNIASENEARALAEVSDTLYLDVWESTSEWVDIRMARDVVPSMLGLLPPSLQISYTPLMHDLAQTVYESYPNDAVAHDPPYHQRFTPPLANYATKSDESRELFFREYQPLSVIEPWMSLMASLFPSHVEKFSIGLSYEEREIPALRIGARPPSNDDDQSPRRTILLIGGSHAREWISTSTVNYVAHSLITRYGHFPAVTKLLEEFDFVFIPTINPDGYVYSWDVDRLWRKNRQSTDLQFCHGIDLDRAWGFEWDGELTRSNPCSESYAGGGPFEGVEASRLAHWARNETENNNITFVTFVDLHSYSQQVLYPYSYTCTTLPPSLEDLQEVAMGLAKAFRLTNSHFYGVSSACEGSVTASDSSGKEVRAKLGLGGGSALDWFYHELGVKYSYQVKLRDTGSYGFLLPRSHIVPTGQETFNAMLSLGKHLLGDQSLGLDWEKELIAVKDQRSENIADQGQQQEQEVVNDTDIEDAHEPVEEEVEEDWMTELKRRRRRR